MKRHVLGVPLALLSAALLLGCQEQGSSPVGPEGLGPQFGHKPSHNPGGGGGDGDGKTVEVDFAEIAGSDFQSSSQTVSGSNTQEPHQG